jgi:bacteriorhodopsin
MEKLWFKRKHYGWGWYPVSWQGWVVTFAYVILIVSFAKTIDENSPVREIFFTFLLPVTLLTIIFIRIGYKKGEKPKWQWGNKNHDKS